LTVFAQNPHGLRPDGGDGLYLAKAGADRSYALDEREADGLILTEQAGGGDAVGGQTIFAGDIDAIAEV
jgi:hypothetical protein